MSSVWDLIISLMDVSSAVGLEAQSHTVSSACSGPMGLGKGWRRCPQVLLGGAEPAVDCSSLVEPAMSQPRELG